MRKFKMNAEVDQSCCQEQSSLIVINGQTPLFWDRSIIGRAVVGEEILAQKLNGKEVEKIAIDAKLRTPKWRENSVHCQAKFKTGLRKLALFCALGASEVLGLGELMEDLANLRTCFRKRFYVLQESGEIEIRIASKLLEFFSPKGF